MKIFWCWQSDTPGKIGRHFIRDALAAAISALREEEDVDEPLARDERDALHLDHDRKDVSGSPDLAATIFDKINRAAVFVADVTFVGAGDEVGKSKVRKKLINPNVAIEFGYALRACGDRSILMVQNKHFGDREHLPFDLQHKAGPIQFRLAPNATSLEIASAKKTLVAALTPALKACLSHASISNAERVEAPEIPFTTDKARFWQPGEVLAEYDRGWQSHGSKVGETIIEYRFDQSRSFYLRLIPGAPITKKKSFASLVDLVQKRRVRVLSRTMNSGSPGRNRYGAIAYEEHGDSTTPLAFTQLFQNCEIWTVSRQFTVPSQNVPVFPIGSLMIIMQRVLPNFFDIMQNEFHVALPYKIELGATGLIGMRLPLLGDGATWGNGISGPLYSDECIIRDEITALNDAEIRRVFDVFAAEIYDLAGLEVPPNAFS